MQENPSPRRHGRRNYLSTEHEDALVQRAVFAHVLAEHPTQLTLAELVRQICADPEAFAEGDAVERAVRDLVGVGLLHRDGQRVWPTRAALHFDRLGLD